MKDEEVDLGYFNGRTPAHEAHSQDRWLITTPKYSHEPVLWPSCQHDLEDSGHAFNRSYSTTPDHNRTITFFWKYFM